MFTIEQRDAVRARVLRLAADDDRVVAAAVVGSLAAGGGDRYSDLDLAFGISEASSVGAVLADWTDTLIAELDAVRLADLERGTSIYRVFLLPGALQVDLSMTPAAHFRAAGNRFELVFGDTAAGEHDVAPLPGHLVIPTPAVATDLFGWGVIYALHARACIERGRAWQAEHYVGAVRDHALSLACLRHGLPAVQARGYDDLPAAALARFARTHVAAVEIEALRPALAACVSALLLEGMDADLVTAKVVAERLAELR
jgi:hypothetical protein